MRRIVSAIGLAVMLMFCMTPQYAYAADAQVTYHITNGGQDVGDKGGVHFYPAGHHDADAVGWGASGEVVKIPAGTYDVRLNFDDGAAHKEWWINNQTFSGAVTKTVEVGIPVAEVTYRITNGGQDTGDNGQVHFYPPGHHDASSIAWAASGNAVRIPAGTYDVQVTFDDGSAHKEWWINNQTFSGTVTKTVEVGMPVAEVTYHIANGGKDTGDNGQVHFYPPGRHDASSIAWAASGDAVRIPAGTYDVKVDFNDGSAAKTIWLNKQNFSGKVDKTVEVGVKVAQVTYHITNGGKDTGDNGQVHFYPPGQHDASSIAWATSGNSVRIPAGAYDVRVTFDEGFAHKEMWLNNQTFSGKVDKTVDMGLTLARPTVTVTEKGVDVSAKADVTYMDPAEGYEVGSVKGGETAVLEADTYDIRASVPGAKAWLRKVAIHGIQHFTIELEKPKTDLQVTVLRNSKPLSGAWCGVYQPGNHSEALSRADSGAWQKVKPATYDIGCFYNEGGITESAWLKGQTLKPKKTQLTINLPSELASLTVTATGSASAPGAGGKGKAGANIEFILDASGSMRSKVDKKSTRMQVAKAVLTDTLAKLPDHGVNVALRIYGAHPKVRHDCHDTTLAVPLGPVDKTALAQAVAGVTPRGWTPIALNLKAAAHDLPRGGTNALVLITDGLEDCGGDPCAVASRLADQGVVTRSFVVGFTLGRDRARLLQCVGHYYAADDRAQLAKALSDITKKALAPPTGTVTLTAADGTLAGEGSLGQRIAVCAGRYDVRIASGGRVRMWKGVEIKGNMVAPLADKPPH